MKTAIRIFAGIIVIVVAIVAAGVAILAATDPADIRDFLTAQVKDATGRELSINGELDLEISLVPSLVMHDVTFANAKWASAPHLLSLKKLEAGLELLPLMQGDIRLTQIVLIEPNIQLETNAKGLGNWVFENTTGKQQPAGSDDGAATIPVLSRLLIENGSFNFKDGQSGEIIALKLNALKVDAESVNRAMLVELKGGYNDIPFEVKGGLPSLERLVLDPAIYKFDITAKALAATVNLKGNIARPLSDQKIDIIATVDGEDINKTVDLAAKLVPQLSDFKLPKLGAVKASARIQGIAAKMDLSELKYAVGPTDNLDISGGGNITGLPDKPLYDVSFSAKGSDLGIFSELAGMKLPKAPPYEIAGVYRNLRGNYAVDNLKLKLGASDLGGNVIVSLKGKVPDIRGALKSDNFDLADILAALPQSDAPEAKKKDDGRVFPDDSLPLDGLRAANVEFKFLGKKIKLGGALVNDLSAGLKLQKGNLVLDPFRSAFAKGQMKGALTLDASSKLPKLVVNFSAKGTDIGKLLKDMAVSDLLSGTADTKIELSGSGASLRQIMAGLNGKTEIIMKEGEVASKYLDLIAADLLKSIVPGGSADTTKINCLVNRFDIKNGIATNTGMLFDTEKMTISGGGKIDLRTEKLDMKIKPQPKDASLLSLATPIDIGGTLKSPTALPSTVSVLKGIAGIALGPVGILALTVSKGSGDKNPCVAALDQAKSGKHPAAQKAPAEQKSSNPVKSITEGIGSSLKSLFGGK
ncbi:MAG: AsmA family protein [Rhodospirillaceae bacterium]|jgi:AsmA family protein|nr:AsmA family protein [Rhodospirillaceae bacterium]